MKQDGARGRAQGEGGHALLRRLHRRPTTPSSRSIARTTAEILKSGRRQLRGAGQGRAVLRQHAACAWATTTPTRRWRRKNIELAERRWASERIVTSCSGCNSVLREEYEEFGGLEPEVMHSLELVDELIDVRRHQAQEDGQAARSPTTTRATWGATPACTTRRAAYSRRYPASSWSRCRATARTPSAAAPGAGVKTALPRVRRVGRGRAGARGGEHRGATRW